MRYILALIIAVPLLAVSLEADAGLVEDLRSGKSDVRASSTQGSRSGIIRFWRQMKSQPDFKAIASAQSWSYGVMGRYSAEAAVEGALTNCKESGGGVTRCEVYAVGDSIVQGRSQAELADAIEAYQLEVSGTTATKPVNEFFKGNERLEEILKGDGNFCKTGVGKIYGPVARRCGDFGDTKITKAEYDRLKDKKTDTASTTEPETASSGDDPLEAKLEKLQKLLEKGLLTEEEAAAKRAKLLEGL